ncbi:MAG: hypothetical protein ABUS51_06700 [Acidobacteriota bacterium]
MNCPLLSEQTADVLLDYSAGRLEGAKAAKLEAHMTRCARCAGFRAGQTELWAVLDAWEPQPVSMGFNRELWRKIDQAAAAPWHRKLADALRFGGGEQAFPLATATVLVVAGILLDHHRPAATSQNFASPGVSMTEADQVEKTLDDIQLLRQFDAVAADTSKRPM